MTDRADDLAALIAHTRTVATTSWERAKDAGEQARYENLSGTYQGLLRILERQGRELHHHVRAACDAEAERDELLVRVQELKAELVEARGDADARWWPTLLGSAAAEPVVGS